MSDWWKEDELVSAPAASSSAGNWWDEDENVSMAVSGRSGTATQPDIARETKVMGENAFNRVFAREDLADSPTSNITATMVGLGADVASPIARLTGNDEYADELNRFGDAYQHEIAKTDEQGYVPPIIKRGLRGAGRSIPPMVIAGTVSGPYGSLGVAGGMEANRAITEGRDAGLKGGDLAAYAVEQGLVEAGIGALLQRVGLGGTEDYFKGGVGSKSIREAIGTAFKRTVAQEIPEEIATEIGHNVVSKLNDVDPNALSPESIWQTIKDTTVQTIITGGFFGATDAGGIALQKFAENPSRANYKAAFNESPPPLPERQARAEKIKQRQTLSTDERWTNEVPAAETPSAAIDSTTAMPSTPEQLAETQQLPLTDEQMAAMKAEAAAQANRVVNNARNQAVNEADVLPPMVGQTDQAIPEQTPPTAQAEQAAHIELLSDYGIEPPREGLRYEKRLATAASRAAADHSDEAMQAAEQLSSNAQKKLDNHNLLHRYNTIRTSGKGVKSLSNQDLIARRDGDKKLKELQAEVDNTRRQESVLRNRRERYQERVSAKAKQKAGEIDAKVVPYAPLHELPPDLSKTIQAEAESLLKQTKNEKVKLALEKIVRDAGADRGRDVESQKERIVGILTGEIDQRTVNEKKSEPPRPVDPIATLFLAKPEERAEMLAGAIASVNNDDPDALAEYADRQLQEASGVPFTTPDEVIGYLESLAQQTKTPLETVQAIAQSIPVPEPDNALVEQEPVSEPPAQPQVIPEATPQGARFGSLPDESRYTNQPALGLTGEMQPAETVQRQPREAVAPVASEAPKPTDEFQQAVQEEEFLRDVIAVMRGKDSPEMSPDQNAVLQEAGRRMEGANTPAGRRTAIRKAETEWREAKKRGRKAVLGDEAPPLPPEPTTAAPGTAEKIAIMRDRIANGYAADHPMDVGGTSEYAMGFMPNQQFHADLARTVSSVTAGVRRFLKNFTKEGALPGNVFRFTEEKNRWLGTELKQMEFNRKDLERVAKDVYKKRLTASQQEVVDQVLKGQQPLTAVPLPLRAPIKTMRDHVDAMSRWLIDSGAIEGPLTVTIENNMGTYLTRSYRLFDDPKWAERVPQDVRNRAAAFIRSENPGWSDQQIEGEIRNLLYEPEAPLAYLAGSRLGSKDLSITKRRKGVPPEIRALFGEYTDPRVNYVRSVTKMATLLANHHFLNEVRKDGLGKYLFDPANPGTNYSPEYHAELSSETSKVMAPLNGLRTTPEIKQAFEDAFNSPQYGSLAKLYFKLNAMTKYGKTVLSVQSNIRNFLSNALIAVAQGHWRANKMGDAFKGMLGGTGMQSAKQWREYYKSAVAVGVVDESVHAGELKDATKDAMDLTPEQFSDRTIDKMVRAVSGAAQGFYQAGDNVWKIYAWENEKARYREAYPSWTDEQVSAKAAEIVRNTYPTYSRISKNIKAIRRFPLTGTFVSFPAEVVRTTYHTLKQTAEELNNPATAKIGAQRLAGVLSAAVLPAALGIASKFMFGIGDDDEEDFRKFVAPWQENSDLVWIDRVEDGKGTFVDLSFSDPYNYLRTPVRAFLRGEDWEESLSNAAWESMAPFAEEEILAGALMDARSNKKDSGGPIYNEQLPLPERFKEQVKYVWDKALEPGTITTLKRIEKAASGTVDKTGRAYDLKTEVMSLGARAVPIDVRQGLTFRAGDYNRESVEAEKIVNSVANSRGTVTPEEIAQAYETSNTARRKLFDTLHGQVQAAHRLGVPETEIYTTLRASGISQDDARLIIGGRYVPHYPGRETLKSILSRQNGESRVKQLGDLYNAARE